jgi:hypothetical protein
MMLNVDIKFLVRNCDTSQYNKVSVIKRVLCFVIAPSVYEIRVGKAAVSWITHFSQTCSNQI